MTAINRDLAARIAKTGIPLTADMVASEVERFRFPGHRTDIIPGRPYVVFDASPGVVAQVDGLRLAYFSSQEEAQGFANLRNAQHRAGIAPEYIHWHSEHHGAYSAMAAYIARRPEAATLIAAVVRKAGYQDGPEAAS